MFNSNQIVGEDMADPGSRPGRRRRVSDDEILRVLREADTPVLTTSGVADELPIERRGMLNRLKALHKAGRVESMDVAKAKVWWILEDSDGPRTPGGPADPLLDLVGLFEGDTEAADRARKRSEEWGEAFDQQMSGAWNEDGPDTEGI
jgi:predicted ArsR family transcriptional regulator